jgi:hypothetical protein
VAECRSRSVQRTDDGASSAVQDMRIDLTARWVRKPSTSVGHQSRRAAPTVEARVTPCPLDIGLLGADAVMFKPYTLAQPLERNGLPRRLGLRVLHATHPPLTVRLPATVCPASGYQGHRLIWNTGRRRRRIELQCAHLTGTDDEPAATLFIYSTKTGSSLFIRPNRRSTVRLMGWLLLVGRHENHRHTSAG